jgi:histidine triad (HIT) family protein
MKNVSRRDFLITGASAGFASLALHGQTLAQTKEDCVFCQFTVNKGKFFKIWEDRNFLAFLDYKPINPGHILLIPKKHLEYVFEMDEKLYKGIFERARRLSKPIKTATEAKRVGMIVEGFGMAHAHVHLIPLYKGSELLKKGATDVTDEEFAKMAEKIRAAIDKT